MEFETFSCIVYDRKMIKKKADCSMDSFKFQPRKISSDTIAIRLILDDYTRQTQFFISSNFKLDVSALHKDFYGVIAEVMYKFCLEEINKIETERNIAFQDYPDKLDIYNKLRESGFQGFY
jgi:hypothetical protein